MTNNITTMLSDREHKLLVEMSTESEVSTCCNALVTDVYDGVYGKEGFCIDCHEPCGVTKEEYES